jgi:hypothetical protein
MAQCAQGVPLAQKGLPHMGAGEVDVVVRFDAGIGRCIGVGMPQGGVPV